MQLTVALSLPPTNHWCVEPSTRITSRKGSIHSTSAAFSRQKPSGSRAAWARSTASFWIPASPRQPHRRLDDALVARERLDLRPLGLAQLAQPRLGLDGHGDLRERVPLSGALGCRKGALMLRWGRPPRLGTAAGVRARCYILPRQH